MTISIPRYLFLIFLILFTNTVSMYGSSDIFEQINQDFEHQIAQTNNFLQTIYTEIDTVKQQDPAPFKFPDDTIQINAYSITAEKAPLLFRCLVKNFWKLCSFVHITPIPIYVYTAVPKNDYIPFNFQICFTASKEPFLMLSEYCIKLFMQPSFHHYFFALLAHELGHVFHKTYQEIPDNEFIADEFVYNLIKQSEPLINALALRDFAEFLSVGLQELYQEIWTDQDIKQKIKLLIPTITIKTIFYMSSKMTFLKKLLNAPTNTANIICIFLATLKIFENIPKEQLLQKSSEEIAQLLFQQFTAIAEDKKQTVLTDLRRSPAYIEALKEQHATHPPFAQRAAKLENMGKYNFWKQLPITIYQVFA